MKESIANNRPAANRANGYGAQRPGARRDRTGKSNRKPSPRLTLKIFARWLPLASKIAFVVLVAVLLVAGYHRAAAASFFKVNRVDVSGTSRISAERIAAVVRRKAAATNVWRLDLNNLSGEIEKEPWVRSAVVSRVLPNGVRVRVTERSPVAVVRTDEGQLVWVDDEAVLLERVAPTDDLPPFFIRGFDETLTAAAQAENRRRISAVKAMTDEWRMAKLTERISEVNVQDLRDVRAQLSGRDAAVEVWLGAGNFGSRLNRAIKVIDAERDAPDGRRGRRIVRLYATSEKRVTLGLSDGANTETEATEAVAVNEHPAETKPREEPKRNERTQFAVKPEPSRSELNRTAQPHVADARTPRAAERAIVKGETAKTKQIALKPATKQLTTKPAATKQTSKQATTKQATPAERPRRVG